MVKQTARRMHHLHTTLHLPTKRPTIDLGYSLDIDIYLVLLADLQRFSFPLSYRQGVSLHAAHDTEVL